MSSSFESMVTASDPTQITIYAGAITTWGWLEQSKFQKGLQTF